MDPLSAILLIGIMTVATVKTGGNAVSDGIRAAQGKTPFSQERWQAREERRRQRGEQPRKDPGGLRRIWQNQTEFLAEKSAHKHQGKLDYLARNGGDIATGKRERMEAADRRRQLVGGKLASAGGTSWEALRTAAQKAADAKRNHDERKTEQAAWRENERRDTDTDGWIDDEGRGHPRQYRSENRSGWELPVVYGENGTPYCVHPDGSWSPYESVPIEVEDAVDDGTVVPFQQRPSTSDSTTTDAEDAPGTDTARGGGHRGGGSSTGWATGSQSGPPFEQLPWWRDINWHREHYQHRMQEWDAREAEPAATDTDPDELDPASTDTSTNTGGTSMTQHSGEITNLSDALDYVRSASEYCEQLYGQFETSLSQAHSAAEDIGNEAGGMETAISSLTGFDLTNEAGRLSAVREHYTAVVQAMTDVETAISAAREALSSAQSELDTSAEEFEAQTGISEQASSHDEVANDMRFYVENA